MLAKLSDQSERTLAMILRPSEADLVLTSIVYYFHQIVENDPALKRKGMEFIQKVNWDSELCQGYLDKAIAPAKGGIYFGRAGVYHDVFMRCAVDKHHHHIYGEGLNMGIILNGPFQKSTEDIAAEILAKTYKLKSKDCTSLGTVLIHASVFDVFVDEFSKQTAEINKNTNIGTYNKKELEYVGKLIEQHKGEKVIGSVYPQHHTSDVILNIINRIHDRHIDILAMETPTPLLNIVKVNDLNHIKVIVHHIMKKATVPKFSSIVIYGSDARIVEAALEPFSHLVKKNRCDFSPYEPHFGSYFLRDFINTPKSNEHTNGMNGNSNH